MKPTVRGLSAALLSLPFFPMSAFAARFEHIVVIVQENRTPDNLFQGLCGDPKACGVPPQAHQYDIQTSNWLNKNSQSGVTQPIAVELGEKMYDPGHDHQSFNALCDIKNNLCQMDGAADQGC